jgi:hypothetical protein
MPKNVVRRMESGIGSMANSGVVRRSVVVWLLVQRWRILGLLVDGTALVLLWQEFFDFPVVLLDADGEFEIFAGDGIPVLFLASLARSKLLRICGSN